MMFRTHALGAISSLWILRLVPNAVRPDATGVLAALAVVGTMLPDLDAADSKIRRVSVAGLRPLDPVGRLLNRTFGHRGLLHSPVGLVAFAAICIAGVPWWGWPASAALILGYASHLATDACTPSGIPLKGRSSRRIHLLPRRIRIVTGSAYEELVFALAASGTLLFLLQALRV